MGLDAKKHKISPDILQKYLRLAKTRRWKAAARCTFSPLFFLSHIFSLSPSVSLLPVMIHILLHVVPLSLSAPSLWLWFLLSLVFPSVTTVLSESEGFMANWPVILNQTPILKSFVEKKGPWSLFQLWYNSVCLLVSGLYSICPLASSSPRVPQWKWAVAHDHNRS